MSIYDFVVKDNKDKDVSMADYKGKVLLIVNQDEKEHSFNLDWKPDAQWAFMSVAAEAQCKFEDGRFSMKMPAGDIALILTGGSKGFAPERKRLENLFQKIRKFKEM